MRFEAVLIGAALACIVLVSLLATAAAQEPETGPPAQSQPPSGGNGGASANATSTPPTLPPPPFRSAEADLDPPPAPGSFSASVTGRTSVSLSWQVQSGIEAHHLAYRVNTSGQTWSRVNLGAGAGSYAVSGLACGTGYRFAVKARGDGTTYERVWGAYARTTASTNSCPAPAPTATPTPTPTATPEPFANLRAAPTSINVGETTDVVASDIIPDGVRTKFTFTDHLARGACPSTGRTSGDPTIPEEATITLRGCKAGTATVWLRTFHGNVAMGSVNVTVTAPAPPPPPPPPPAPPTNPFTAPSNFRYVPSSTTSGQATFYWTAAGNADSHKIEKHMPDLIPFDNDWHQVGGTLGGAVSQVTLSNISTDSVEEYRIAASKSSEDDKHSNVVEVRLKLIPQNLVAERAGHGRAKLTWDPIDSAQSYVIQRRSRVIPLEGYSDWPTSSIESVPALDAATGKITAVVKDLPPGKEARFKVKAKSVHTLSEASVPSNTLTITDDRPSGPPTGEKMYKTTPGYRSIVLEWNDDSNGHTGYLVESTPASALVDNTQIYNHGSDKKRLHIDGLPYNARYTFDIYAVNVTPVEAVKSDEAARLSFNIPEPYHWTGQGHQRDHTVEWSSSVSTTSLSDALDDASTDWHNAIMNTKRMRFCKSGAAGCSAANADNFVVQVVEATTDLKGTGSPPPGTNTGCGSSYACVKPQGGESAPPSSEVGAVGKHMGNLTIVYESPPWVYYDRDRDGTPEHLEIVWTRNIRMEDSEVLDPMNQMPTGKYYRYVDGIALHEFGHTLGLPDYYSDAGDRAGMQSAPAIMWYTNLNSIQAADTDQLFAIYRFNAGPH